MPGGSLDDDDLDAPSPIDSDAPAGLFRAGQPLDESKVQPGCNRSDLCSPYMRQPWAHDARCPLSLGTKR